MKKTCLFLLLGAMALILLSASAAAAGRTVLATGECGDSVTWEAWEDADGVRTLEVSGSGPVTQTIEPEVDNIERIIVNSGVTSICDNAFIDWSFFFVREISLPASCTSIGEFVFFSDNLRSLTLAEGLQTIGAYAFFPRHGSPHAYCVAVIPASVTQFGYGTLDDLIPAVYPNSPALAYCQQYDIEYILLNSTGSNSHRMALLKAVAQVEDVPLRYRGLVVSVLQTMNLTNSQCDSLRTYVLDEEQALKRAMLDNSMTTGEILGFLQRFTAKMNNVGVQINYEIDLINGFPGVHLTATVNGQDTSVEVYRTEDHLWTVKNVTPSEENGYLYVESEEGVTITGYSGNDTNLVIPASVNGKPVVSIAIINPGFPNGITSLTIPEGVKVIGDRAFSGQDQLTALSLPDSLETIGSWAFSWCFSLTSVTIPGNVKDIGEGAFYDCELTDVYFNGTEAEWNNISIGYYNEAIEDAERHYTVIDTGSCGENVIWKVREGADGVRTLEVSGSGPVTQTVNPSVDHIERIIVSSGVTSICDNAFENWNFYHVRELSLPASCTSIGESVFFSENLRTLTLAEGLQEIGDHAFGYGSHAYCVAVIPASVTQIGRGALNNLIPAVYPNSAALAYCLNNGIENYILLNGAGDSSHRMALLKTVAQVTDVPLRYRGLAVSVLQSMSLTDSQCDSLRDYVLEEEQTLKTAMLDNSLTISEITGFVGRFITMMNQIGVGIDYSIDFINGFPGVHLTVTLNGQASTYDVYRTGGTWTIQNVTPSESSGYLYVESEDGIIITGYTGTDTALAIPASIRNTPVVSIMKYNAGFPEGITSITIPEGVKTIGPDAFSNQEQLTALTLPDSLEIIGDYAFYYCTGLTSVTVPAGVSRIGHWAFGSCYNLTSVTIPAGVNSIGNGAFGDCNLTDIFYGGTTADWNNIDFGYFNENLENAKLHCHYVPDLILPAQLTVIESEAFAGLPEGIAVLIPGSVTSIGKDAFSEGVIIVAPQGSYAASWADENGFVYGLP